MRKYRIYYRYNGCRKIHIPIDYDENSKRKYWYNLKKVGKKEEK